jgi:hypothetical protein
MVNKWISEEEVRAWEEGWVDLDGAPQPPPSPSEHAPVSRPAPHRYEDQYGNMRWSDDHSRVVHPSKDGR